MSSSFQLLPCSQDFYSPSRDKDFQQKSEDIQLQIFNQRAIRKLSGLDCETEKSLSNFLSQVEALDSLQKSKRDYDIEALRIKRSHKPDQTYILYSTISCLLFTTSSLIRYYNGSDVFFNSALITSNFFIPGLIYFLYKYQQAFKKNQAYYFPWNILVLVDGQNIQYRFDTKAFVYLILGGSFEFFGNQMFTLAYDHAKMAGINQGIVGALESSNTFYILIASYYMFSERVRPVQLMGVLIMVLAITMVSLFTSNSHGRPHESSSDIDLLQLEQIDNIGYHQALTIIGGLASALFYGQQILIFKSVARLIRDEYAIAFSFTLFGSMYGLACLAYLICFNPQIFATYTFINYFSAFGSGILISLGIVFINVASEMGNAGICNAIMHGQSVLLTVGNFVLFGQSLNYMQGMGVFLSAVGATVISLADLCKRR
eukprot:403376566